MKSIFPIPEKAQSNLKVVRVETKATKIAVSLKGGEYRIIDENLITYCKANGSETILYFEDGEVVTIPKSLKRTLEFLPNNDFHRVHHSYAVNICYVKRYFRKKNGGDLKLVDGTIVPVSEKQKNATLGLFRII